jgi:hypothetical protein
MPTSPRRRRLPCGAVLVGLILGTMVTYILEKKFLYAAIASAVGAVLSFVGLIHAPEVAWAAHPEVALGYLFFGIVCVAYSFLPGAKESGGGRRGGHRRGSLSGVVRYVRNLDSGSDVVSRGQSRTQRIILGTWRARQS